MYKNSRTTRILQLLKDINREACIHEIERYLGVPPSHFYWQLSDLLKEGYIVKLFEKGKCKHSDRAHAFYRFKKDVETEKPTEPVTTPVQHPCACGCGKNTIPGNEYIHGHNARRKLKPVLCKPSKAPTRTISEHEELKIKILKELLRDAYVEIAKSKM